ncbi:MAG: hypothetical protein KGM97_08995, partial [Alphaproteobacteria bacterium]|nr:hypothetical protein [Alphaproteobacteria bacterium]
LAQLTLDVITKKYVADKAGHVFVIKNGVRAAMEGYAADAKGNVTLTTGGGMRIPMPMIKTDGSATNTVTTKLHFFGRLGADHPHYSADVAKVIKEINPANDAELKKEPKSGMNWFLSAGYRVLVNVESNPDALNGPLTVWIPRLLFLLLPLFALLLAAFYWRRRREFYYVDHLVFSLSTHSFAFVVLAAAAVAAQFVPGEFVAWPTFGVLALYLLLALKRFYGQGWLATGLKFVGIGIIYPTFFLAPSLGAAIVASVVAA